VTATIKAISIDPLARTVFGIEVPVGPLFDEPDAGPQVNFKRSLPLIGCDSVEMFYLPNGRDSALIDAEGLYPISTSFSWEPAASRSLASASSSATRSKPIASRMPP
jgi:hypothetical protein